MNKVLIIGCGIIGGSLIRTLQNKSEYQISFYDTQSQTVKEIQNSYNLEFSDDFNDFEHIFLCIPIKFVFKCLDKLKELNVQATIYDCSSTKFEIEQYAVNKKLNYIGLHPMCGSEKSGFEYSKDNLFKDKTIIATKRTKFIENLCYDLGGNLKVIESDTHDRLVAQISHSPQLMSLVINRVDDDARRIAGNGFKDMTRISQSPYEMWEDILRTNKVNIINELTRINEDINLMIKQLENEEFEKLEEWFNK